jgi:hypothetical protein
MTKQTETEDLAETQKAFCDLVTSRAAHLMNDDPATRAPP